MTGGAGLDRMVLESLSNSGVTFAARDVINTFAHGDKIDLTAIERGLTPETVREDKPINIKGWKPENYTKEYFGPVTLTPLRALKM